MQSYKREEVYNLGNDVSRGFKSTATIMLLNVTE